MKKISKNNRLKNIILKKNNTIFDAVKKLNETNFQVCLVVDKNMKLLGTVTDGDVRRAIIKKIDFKTQVSDIMNKKPVVVNNNFNMNFAKEMMKKKSVLQLPIINKKKEVIDLIIWKDDKNFLNNKVIIMAGGLGKRMRPITTKLPKPMIKFKNKPILEHIINKLRSQGFKDITISIRYLGKKIKNYFKTGESFGVNIEYLNEKKALGTAGSLSLINSKNLKDVTVIINADTIFDLNLIDIINFHKKKKSLMTMALRQEFLKSSHGIIKSKGFIFDKIEEKPIITTYVNAGIYVLEKKIFKYIKENTYLDMPELFNKLKKKYDKKIFLFPIYEKYKELGTLKDLKN
ncbi:sugar phosphate nucleotidyltransferase [Candidatus Pelagibacter sp.]|nr:sugar phosphate nucleotidyltransferase [Candidatus Pelagibacter sp.]